MKRSTAKRAAGQATMEFLLMLPLLLAILGLIAYSGWWSYTRLAAENFAYSSCTGVSRSRGMFMLSQRGYNAAFQTQHFWEVDSLSNPHLQMPRLGAKVCQVTLKDRAGQGLDGRWNFTELVESYGYAFYPPFLSCDDGGCR